MPAPVLVRSGIYWLGTPNPDLRVFDVVMKTPYGTSYNSYLIRGEKVAIVDIVKPGFFDEYEANIRSLVDPADISYIVLQHAEPDHSGCLPELLRLAPNAIVVGSRSAVQLAGQICNCDFRSIVVKDGDLLDLGDRVLRFITAPFLHWPDTILTYSASDRVLFTCDFLGSHYWDGELFLKRSEQHDWAFKYYFDAIMSPYKRYVVQALEKTASLEVDIVATSHGPILDHDVEEFRQQYLAWSKTAEHRSADRRAIVVAECSAYGNTRRIGDALLEGIRRTGELDIVRLDLESTGPDAVVSALERSDGFLVGSPTFNRDAISVVWNLLAVVPAVTFRGMPAAAYGSYGWSGEAVPNIEARLAMLGFKVIEGGPRAILVPSQSDLDAARQFGEVFSEAVRASK